MAIRTTCRVCEGELSSILSLGEHYVSNFLNPGEPAGERVPLELMLCGHCRLLQLKRSVPPESLYHNYWYRSGTNETMRRALADIAHTAERLTRLESGDTVLDIGCNDGTLLSCYSRSGVTKVGFDPARNLAPFSSRVADRVVSDFFGAERYFHQPDLRTRRPRVITSIAMFYDLEDPRRFVADVKSVLHPDGLWVVQQSYLPSMLTQHEVGNVCHEHLEYYSLQSLEYLLDLYDLEVVDVELNDVNGGSFRTYIRNRSADPKAWGEPQYREMAEERVRLLREQESRMRLSDHSTYVEFAWWVERIKQDVVGFIRERVRADEKVYVYGASTKGNTILQYFGLDHTLITAAADRNPAKWNRVTVGTRIPIVSEEEARKARPEYFLILPWHFVTEFKTREREYLASGGRFILPAPHFTLI